MSKVNVVSRLLTAVDERTRLGHGFAYVVGRQIEQGKLFPELPYLRKQLDTLTANCNGGLEFVLGP